MRAVVLAGGKGTRLRPYTTVLPKPLMPIGDMPVLEVVLRQLRASGFSRVTMAVGHLAELLQAFFKDGSELGIEIDYSIESQPLGTVGPLTLVPDLSETFLLMNGDTLTDLNYRDLVEFHRKQGAQATIATADRQVNIDFGVVECDDAGRIVRYIEKPSYRYKVSMGIYVFEPTVLSYLEAGERFDFPDLIQVLIGHGHRVASYPFSGYWMDIGRPDDYARAAEEFEEQRERFLGGSRSQ